MDHDYYVYILSSARGVLYVGLTHDLVSWIAQQKQRSWTRAKKVALIESKNPEQAGLYASIGLGEGARRDSRPLSS